MTSAFISGAWPAEENRHELAYGVEPFGYQYMLNAMWVSAMVAGGAVRVSLLLFDAQAGRSLAMRCSLYCAGVAGARMGLPFSLGAELLSGGLAAGGMLFLNQRSRLKEARLSGLSSPLFLASAFYGVAQSVSVNIQTIILGSVLAIAPARYCATGDYRRGLAILLLKWKDLMVVLFDETHAGSIGLNPGRLSCCFHSVVRLPPWRPCKPLGRSR
ncbi:metal ABC transporter permease [Salmonella enterica subsp. enterica]|nr:metal ABC transporter permease [Salmonella enterica subsp. enterica]